MFGLEYFGFRAVWSPYWLALALGVVVLYLLLAHRWRRIFQEAEPVPVGKQVSFILGVMIYYFAQEGPLGLLAHLTFSGHMTSMSLSYLLAPALMLYGLPAWLVRPILQDAWFKRFSLFLNPVFTILFFNGLFSLYHVPVVHDFVMVNYVIHTLVFGLLLVAALMMWWPIFCPVPEHRTLSDVRKLGYIFLNGALLTPACALIIFAPTALFESFTSPDTWVQALGYCVPNLTPGEMLAMFDGPSFFSSLDPREDQQLGGVIMKLIQEFIYGSVLYYIFSNWYKRERKSDQEEDMNPTEGYFKAQTN